MGWGRWVGLGWVGKWVRGSAESIPAKVKSEQRLGQKAAGSLAATCRRGGPNESDAAQTRNTLELR